MAMYCTVEQAQAVGAIGTIPVVTAAVEQASALVDGYTGTVWSRSPLRVSARVSDDGTVLLPLPVGDVLSVTLAGSDVALADTAWRWSTSLTPGDVDAVYIGGGRGYSILVAGAEPWNGGYAGLLGHQASDRVTVEGTWGPEITPLYVEQATASLAAWLTTGGSLVPPTEGTNTGTLGGIDADDEGNVVSIATRAPDYEPGTAARTTGLAAVDALLRPFIRPVVMVN